MIILGLSAVTLFGLSFLTLLSAEVIKISWAWPPQETAVRWIWQPEQTPAANATAAAMVRARVLLPQTQFPILWKSKSAKTMRDGVDGGMVNVNRLDLIDGACEAQAVVAVGTSSLDGKAAYNRELARERAIALAGIAQQRVVGCIAPPTIFALAMTEPTDERADGFQRKVFVLALNAPSDASPKDLLRRWVLGPTQELALNVTSSPARFRKKEVCDVASCTWDSF